MTDQKKGERKGGGVAETSYIAADPASARRRRLTAVRKQVMGQTHVGGLFVRTVGLARAKTKDRHG